ncbi:MAG: PIN domain-containing protein [Cytophagaceae bacterium]|nr:PIN domain-containing protein [Cytophagaceae bacterium]
METKNLILCDTTILVNAFREEVLVLAEFDRLGFNRFALASTTAAELYFGMRKGEKRKTLELVRRLKMIHFDKAISFRMLNYQYDYLNRMSVPDAIIGATAVEYNFALWTDNRQDFDFLPGIRFHDPA